MRSTATRIQDLLRYDGGAWTCAEMADEFRCKPRSLVPILNRMVARGVLMPIDDKRERRYQLRACCPTCLREFDK